MIDVPEHGERVQAMREELFDLLEESGTIDVRFQRPSQFQTDEGLNHK